jgi:hypothetical protein
VIGLMGLIVLSAKGHCPATNQLQYAYLPGVPVR